MYDVYLSILFVSLVTLFRLPFHCSAVAVAAAPAAAAEKIGVFTEKQDYFVFLEILSNEFSTKWLL